MSIFNPVTNEYTSGIFSDIGKNLYLNGDLCDFHFICKSGNGQSDERVPAHKFLLMSVSEVFRIMFNGSWIEKSEVKIVDAKADAFREFLQFFYFGQIKLTRENIATVMNLAKKYDVTECCNICATFLENNLTDATICWGYQLAIHLEHKELEIFCEHFLGLYAKAMFTSEKFLELDRKTVKSILQMDTLCCSESEVFNAVMRWIETKTKQNSKNPLEYHDLVREIRFGLMTLQEFLALGTYTKMFSPDEFREIVNIIGQQEYQPQIFTANRKERGQDIYRNENIIKCYRSWEAGRKAHLIKNVETTTFSVNATLWLTD